MVTSRYGSYHHKDKVVFENNRFSRSLIYLYFNMPENVFQKIYIVFCETSNLSINNKSTIIRSIYYVNGIVMHIHLLSETSSTST